MFLRQYVLEGLGHLSAMIADERSGRAAIVDPRRDIDVYLRDAAARDLQIEAVLETHLHNDYVSGARELAAVTNAMHAIGAGADLAFEHRELRHGDLLHIGGLAVTALATPGHTPEHISYAVADTSRAADPAVLFTGGSLLVGSVGRTDLLGAERAAEYARDMYRSLHHVLLHEHDYVTVLPTHGAGSLCSTGTSATTFSTIGYERRHNGFVQVDDVEEFVAALIAGQPTFPPYFSAMRETNRLGPRPIGNLPPAIPLSPSSVDDLIGNGALVVDARSTDSHVLGHIPGSLSIPVGPSFGTWLGWVARPSDRVIVVLDQPAEWDDVVRQAFRIGFDEALVGFLEGGVGAWTQTGRPLERTRRLTVEGLAERLEGDDVPLVIDVRQRGEFDSGHIPGSWHIGAGELRDRLASLPRRREIVTICASGFRAGIAASLLRKAGFSNVSWVASGVPAWQSAALPIERGADGPGASTPEGAD